MQKKLYLIGNLKMNFTKSEIVPYLKSLKKLANNTNNVVGVAVPSVYLEYANKYLADSNVWYGAQNCHYKTSGAYTGEVSVLMLKDFNPTICLVGHSERRAYYNESDADVNQKVLKLLELGVKPIICVGEKLEEREAKKTLNVIKTQVKAALNGVDVKDLSNLIFAYEPVWAIGTGKTATVKEAETVILNIKKYVAKLYKLENTDNIVVLYGGSMNEKNAEELLSSPSIDGGLIGGACLNLEKFSAIFNNKIDK